MLSTEGRKISEHANEFVKNLKVGEHGCVFFTSREEFKSIQFTFVKSGLEQNWGVVYTTATETVNKVRYDMKQFGIDVQEHENAGSLVIVRGEDLYKDPENPDLESWTAAAKSICNSFVDKGKKGVRVAADLSSYFLSKGLAKQWFQLEYALERKLAIPLTVVCGYDAQLIPASKDLDIIEYYKMVNRNKGNMLMRTALQFMQTRIRQLFLRYSDHILYLAGLTDGSIKVKVAPFPSSLFSAHILPP